MLNYYRNETNFTLIEINPPDNFFVSNANTSDRWTSIFNNPSSLSDYVSVDKPSIESILDYNTIESKSVPEIASVFNASVFENRPDYTLAYISVPNENYDSFTKVLESMGFKVYANVARYPSLNESVNSIGLPYTYSPGGVPITLTGTGIRIGIIDTGIDPNHPDFSGRLKFWSDTSPEGLSSYKDWMGHGTHVASIAAGSGSNSSGKYKGVAPGADLYIWKACSWSDYYQDCIFDDADIADAVNQAVNHNVNVISMSLGGFATADICRGQGSTGEVAEYNAIINALNHNIAVIIAAGNSVPPGNVEFPACINGVIAVGSTLKKDYPNNFYNPLQYYSYKLSVNHALNINVNSEIVGQSSQSYSAITTDLNSIDNWETFNPAYSSVIFTSQPTSWPATLNLTWESEHKDNPWLSPLSTWWDPGYKVKNDNFWNLEPVFTLSSGPYIVVDATLKPHYSEGPYGWWWKLYPNSFTCSGTPKPCSDFKTEGSIDSDERLIGDVNGDCVVNSTDADLCLLHLNQNWPPCDWDHDGFVGADDLTTVYSAPALACGCVNQHGCAWVGNECVGGVPANCNDDSRTFSPWRCGTPSTTGCSGSWNLDSITSRKVYTKNTPGTKDIVSYFSDRGSLLGGIIKPEVTAPGEFICAAKSSQIDGSKGIKENLQICNNDDYFALSGTSMATPHVSGLVALMYQAYPAASSWDIRKALLDGAQPAGYGTSVEGYGRVNATRAIDNILAIKASGKETCRSYSGGYPDNTPMPIYVTSECQRGLQWYNDPRYDSANEIRNYNINGVCQCTIDYDSYLDDISVNGVSSGDVSVGTSSFITVNVSITNTGFQTQRNWFLGVEFWNVSDYNNPLATRDSKGRINAYFNGSSGSGGCILDPDPLHAVPGSCPNGVSCSMVDAGINGDGILHGQGDIITVSCQVPASFYKQTTGNQRIMFWIHERDLTQDANGNGVPGEWWNDALARSFRNGFDDRTIGGPADVRVNLIGPPRYTNVLTNPTNPALYSPTAIYNFKIDWTDNAAVDEVILEMDGTNYSYKTGQITKNVNTYSMTFQTCSLTYSHGGGSCGHFYLVSMGPIIPILFLISLFLSLVLKIKKKYNALAILFIALVINLFFVSVSVADTTTPCLFAGPHTYKWYANDTFGNWNNTAQMNYNILLYDPVNIYISSPENTTYSTNSVGVNYSISSDFEISWIGYSLDNKPNKTLTGNTSLNLAEGSHNMIYYANTTWGVMNSSQMIYFTVSLPKPDLTIGDILTSGNTISYKINNQGNADASSSYSNLWVDGTYITNDYLTSLAKGSSASRTFSYSWTCSGTSDTIKVCADANNNVFESNENNNCLTKTFTCPAPPTCTCTGWTETGNLCSGYVRGSCYYQYKRTCTPKGCSQESQCVYGGKAPCAI